MNRSAFLGDESCQDECSSRQCESFEGPSASDSIVNNAREFLCVKEDCAQQKEQTQQGSRKASFLFAQQTHTDREQDNSGDIGKNVPAGCPGRDRGKASYPLAIDKVLNSEDTERYCKEDAA